MSTTFTQPKRALCWQCDRKLYGGGRAYATIVIDGIPREVHRCCVVDALKDGGILKEGGSGD